ncbi:hypothetical protein M405DRAFT_287715 [Rhizopogon salebrosus TDB-379]|nr:hypothetical protein M405DRAFT_287715 [Rhizopogon salebrosus TDB-379]
MVWRSTAPDNHIDYAFSLRTLITPLMHFSGFKSVGRDLVSFYMTLLHDNVLWNQSSLRDTAQHHLSGSCDCTLVLPRSQEFGLVLDATIVVLHTAENSGSWVCNINAKYHRLRCRAFQTANLSRLRRSCHAWQRSRYTVCIVIWTKPCERPCGGAQWTLEGSIDNKLIRECMSELARLMQQVSYHEVPLVILSGLSYLQTMTLALSQREIQTLAR